MKKFSIILTLLFLMSCDFSQLLKKEITAIKCVDQINVLPGEELEFELKTEPEKGTVPEYHFDFDGSAFSYTRTRVPGVTLRYENKIKGIKTGKFPLYITETTSKLKKTVMIHCAEMISDFSLPTSKIVSLNSSFCLSDYATFIPADNIIYDFSYEYNSSLITYNEENDFFKAGSNTGEVEILVKEKKTSLTKQIKIIISDQKLNFTTYEVPMITETALPQEVISHITQNNLTVKYPENDGLFIDPVKFTIMATAAKTWTVEFYIPSDEGDSLFGYMDIVATAMENTPFEPITLDVGIKQNMPEALIDFINNNDLKISYNTGSGLSIEIVDYSLIASDSGSWTVEFFKTVGEHRYIFGSVLVTCRNWFTVDFYYAQRVLEKKQYTLLNENSIIDKLKTMNNLSITYSWSGSPMRPLNKDEAGNIAGGTTADAKTLRALWNILATEHWAEDACRKKNTYKRSPQWIESEKNEVNHTNTNFNAIFNDQYKKEKFWYYQYKDSFNPNSMVDNIICFKDCHEADGNAGKSYCHFFYVFPKTKVLDFKQCQDKLNSYFTQQQTKIVERFARESTSESYSLEGVKIYPSSGRFSIKENQDDLIYDFGGVNSGATINDSMSIDTYSATSGSFKKIEFSAQSVEIQKTMAIVKTPCYPVVRKIVCRWESNNMVYRGFTRLANDDHHTFTVSKNDDENQLTIEIREKDLSKDEAILTGVIGHLMFEDQRSNSVYKLLEIIK